MKFLSIEKVLSKVGGPAQLRKVLWRTGQPFPTFQRISMWRARNSIPGSWAGPIIYALACKGINATKLLADTDD